MKTQAQEALEFDDLRQLLAGYAQTPMGRTRLINLSAGEDLTTIRRQHQEVEECLTYQRELGRMRINEMDDPTAALERLAIIGTRLDAEELLQLQRIINIATSIRQEFREVRDRFLALAQIIEEIPNLAALHNRLRATLLPSGEINEDASPELKRVRREINILRTRIYKQLESLIEQAGNEGAVRDEFVTMRNGRFVIPVRNDSRGRVPGVVHGLSSSGATAFVEPITTIEENNEMVRLKEREEAEVIKVLFTLSEELRKELPGLQRLVGALATLDVIVAKADFARDYDCIRPIMNEESDLELIDARHPLLEHNLRASKAQVVPISLALNTKKSAMVISGPNAGGKTVVLKTVGLLAFMAQAGMHIPARSGRMPIFAMILADIGDHQSIAANLSTFSSHIRNISGMATMIKAPALVLLDEVGTGTDPEEGAALGVAIVDFFKRNGAIVMVSTHYNPLKYYATETPGVVNASVEFNERTLQPTYRLLIDIAGTSSGIEIARRLGLQEEILTEATKTLDRRDIHQANFLKIIKAEAERWQDLNIALESERQATADKYQQMDAEFATRERGRMRDLEQQLAKAVTAFNSEATEYISQLTDQNLAAKLSKEREKRVFQLKRRANEVIAETTKSSSSSRSPRDAQQKNSSPKNELPSELEIREFKVGDRVLTELGQQGTVEELKGDDIFVRVGVMRFKTSAGNLRIQQKAEAPKRGPVKLPAGVNLTRQESAEISSELNVIGRTVDEACDQVDKFLDRAFLENYDRVRIVHGMGLGKLRRAISELLQSHPHVANFFQASSTEGGAGATIVELRQ